MDVEPEPTIVARGSWTQDANGDLTYGPEGLPPVVAERLVDANESLWPDTRTPPGRGYRIRAADVWDQARIDYLSGDTATEVCARHGLGLSTFRGRAAQGGWRRVDQPDPKPDPQDLDAADGPAPDYGVLAGRALAQVDRALTRGRAAEAGTWLRVHARLAALAAAHPAPAQPKPAPARDPFDAANVTARAVIALAGQLGRTDPGDPIARAAFEREMDTFVDAIAAPASDDPDDSDDSDAVFFDAESEIRPADTGDP